MVLQAMTCSQRHSLSNMSQQRCAAVVVLLLRRSQHGQRCATRQKVQENCYTFNQTFFSPSIHLSALLRVYSCILSKMGRWRINALFHSYHLGKRSWNHWQISEIIVSVCLRYLYRWLRSPLSLLFSRWNRPSSLSLSLYEKCSSLLIIFVALCWSCSSMSVSLLHWGAQNWTE